jgi:hypothetical protein
LFRATLSRTIAGRQGAIELREKAAARVPKAALAQNNGISRESVYAYLRAE